MATTGHTGRSPAASGLARWLVPPASGWHRKSGSLTQSRLSLPLLGLAGVLLSLGISGYWLLPLETHPLASTLHLILVGSSLALVVTLMVLIYREYLVPLTHLRNWALRIRGGNLAARIPVPGPGEFAELARDINTLGEKLQTLSQDMQSQVRKQTLRIEQKNQSLETLYDVAASINTSRDLDDLLTRFLHTLKDVVNARAAVVRLASDERHMRLVASVGLDDELIEMERNLPHRHCLCGTALRLA